MKHLFVFCAYLISLIWLDPLTPHDQAVWISLLTKLGNTSLQTALWVSIMLVSLYKRKERWFSISYELLAHLALGIVVAYLLKVSIGRVRPIYFENIAYIPFTLNVKYHSTPSSHAMAAFLIALSLPYKKWGLPLATLVALTRVLLGKHYLSDVILGAWVAILVIDYGYRWKPLARLKSWIKKTGRKIPTGLKDS